jgi:nicotinamide-nucleotide amidase
MFSEETLILSRNLGLQCQNHSIKLATAESCTGGLLSSAITACDGSSKWFERGFVTYSNEAKMSLLKVDQNLFEKFGAVSLQVAQQMAIGAIKNSNADMSISITGVAGPSGGSLEKPVGTVFFACADKNKIIFEHKAELMGSRHEIREKAVLFSLNTLLKLTL